MDTHPIDTPAPNADRDRAISSVQKDDEVYVYAALVRDGETLHAASFFLRAACDVCNCLDTARDLAGLGANSITLKAASWQSPRYEYFQWSWRRESKAAQQTKALLESKKRRDAKRDAERAAALCASCAHPYSFHVFGRDGGCCHKSAGLAACACPRFSSGLVRTVAR